MKQNTNLAILVSVLKTAKLTAALEGAGPFTVFAPNNDAFKQIDSVTIGKLLRDVPKLQKILKRHVVNGTKLTNSMFKENPLKPLTLNGDKLNISKKNGDKIVQWNNVQAAVHQGGKNEMDADNGIIHVITSVLTDNSDL